MILIPPVLNGITGIKNVNKHGVSFSYDWSSDAARPINIGGIALVGSEYTLDVSSLSSNVANLPAFRTLLFSQTFTTQFIDDGWDGELIISVSGVGQIMRYGTNQASQAEGANYGMITACVPIVANAPTKITFGKGEGPAAGMFGVLTVSIFDFDIPPFISYGSYNGN